MNRSSGLRFEIDWLPVDAEVRAAELRATWARLEIWMDGECVTLAHDLSTGGLRRAVVVPLYPLAEWAAFNWWRLLYDAGPAREHAAPTPGSHRLSSAGDGFTWPDVAIVPQGEVTVVRWRLRKPRAAGLEFVGAGQARTTVGALQLSLTSLIEAVLERLADASVIDTPLQDEWRRLTGLTAEEVEFCRASARLGLDPFSEGLDYAPEIEAVKKTLDAALVDDLLDAVEPERLRGAVAWAASAGERAATESAGRLVNAFALDPLREPVIRAGSGPADTRPWERGYRAARTVRQHLDLPAVVPFPDSAPVRLAVEASQDTALQGLGRRPAAEPTANLVVPRELQPTSARFAVARSLWHLLAQSGDNPFLLTAAATTPQQVGRAFAAELLAPAEGIRRLLGEHRGGYSDEALAEVAQHYATSDLVVAHQVENQLAA